MAAKGCYLAIYFPVDDPPGWAWGKPLTNTEKTGAKNFWVNSTAEGEPYDPDDDVKIEIPSLNAAAYKKSWAVVARIYDARPAPGDATQVRIPR